MMIEIADLVAANLYEDEADVIQDAFRHFLLDHPELRIQVAIHQYRTDPDLSLAKAASIAGVSYERMKEILTRQDIPLRLGPEDLEEALDEIEALRTRPHARSDQ
jgi:predicted HTH domain antitoxin